MSDQNQEVYALLGNPVRHSLSPVMHNAAYREMGVRATYVPFCVDDLEKAVAGLKALGIRGASITIPFKRDIMPLLDEIDPDARAVGAVNTVSNRRGLLIGINTDWIGLRLALEDHLSISGKTFVIVGSGGAARAAVAAVVKAMGKPLVLSRNREKAGELAMQFGCRSLPLTRIDEVEADCLINATPVGMFPRIDASPVPRRALDHFRWVMDTIYNPLETKLLRDAQTSGCKVISGLDMFVHQGAEQIRFWMDREPPTDVMRRVAMEALSAEDIR